MSSSGAFHLQRHTCTQSSCTCVHLLCYVSRCFNLEIMQVVQESTPLNDPYTYKGGANAMRSYHKWRGPERFCVVGDAYCVLNPRFGNGMTVAAIMAERLGLCLVVRSCPPPLPLSLPACLPLALSLSLSLCVRARVCVRGCVCMCVCLCAHACVRVLACPHLQDSCSAMFGPDMP